MGEGRGDFLDVMRDEDERRSARLVGEDFDEVEKLFARNRIEAGAGLVEDEELRLRHEGAGDEYALAFTLRKLAPKTFGECARAGETQEFLCGAMFGGRDPHPQVELRVFAADDRFKRGFIGRHAGLQGAGYEADFEAQFAPVALAVTAPEQLDFARAGSEVAGEGFKEQGLAAAVWAEDDPVFAPFNTPGHVGQQGGAIAYYSEAGNGKKGAAWHEAR